MLNGHVKKEREYDLEERLISFAVMISEIADRLPRTRLGRHVYGQLVRCGTSVAPNYAEAQNAESRRDFIHKMKICLKELGETVVWLKLSLRTGSGRRAGAEAGLREATELTRIFATSIQTAKRNSSARRPPQSPP
jgi:four helix bundle protein